MKKGGKKNGKAGFDWREQVENGKAKHPQEGQVAFKNWLFFGVFRAILTSFAIAKQLLFSQGFFYKSKKRLKIASAILVFPRLLPAGKRLFKHSMGLLF